LGAARFDPSGKDPAGLTLVRGRKRKYYLQEKIRDGRHLRGVNGSGGEGEEAKPIGFEEEGTGRAQRRSELAFRRKRRVGRNGEKQEKASQFPKARYLRCKKDQREI